MAIQIDFEMYMEFGSMKMVVGVLNKKSKRKNTLMNTGRDVGLNDDHEREWIGELSLES